MSNSYVNVKVSHGAIMINFKDTCENWTSLTVDEARDLAERLKTAASKCERESVVNIIRNAVSQIHAERYGMTVREHEELDRTRWHSLREQEWEYRVRVRHAKNGQTTLEGYR